MSDQDDDLQSRVRVVAEKAVQAYTQGILQPEALVEQIFVEWERVAEGRGAASARCIGTYCATHMQP